MFAWMQADRVMLFFSLLSFLMGMVYLIYFHTGRRQNYFLLAFVFGKFLQGFGIGFIGLKDQFDVFASPWLASILLTIGMCTEVFVFVSYEQVFKRKVFRYFAALALAGTLGVLLSKGAGDAMIVMTFNGILALVFFSGVYLLAQKPTLSRFARVTMFSFVLFGAAWLLASIHAFVHRDDLNMLSPENSARALLNVISVINFVIVSLGYIMVLKELDEAKLVENARRIAEDNKALHQLNASKTKLFSIIAHDLRGPIGGLSQLGESLVEMKDELNLEERNHLLKLIADTSKSSFLLLENLLLWARSESGDLECKPRSTNLAAQVDASLSLLHGSIENKQIKLKKSYTDEAQVYADATMISTVIRNLLSNAVKFVKEGGTISIQVKIKNERVQLEIQDDGIGMPQDKLNSMLRGEDKFLQPGTKREAGTGLGLKLCREFIAKNNGSFDGKSTVGKGTKFFVVLPMAEDAVSHRAQASEKTLS